jgi:hypothetical protein
MLTGEEKPMRDGDPRGESNRGSHGKSIVLEDLAEPIGFEVDHQAFIAPDVRVSESLLMAWAVEVGHRCVQDLLSSVALSDEAPAAYHDNPVLLRGRGLTEAAFGMAAPDDAQDHAVVIGKRAVAQHATNNRA